jgi:hypothetical protein
MQRNEIDEILDRVRSWPRDQQERVVQMLITLENGEADTEWLREDDARHGAGK